MRKYIPTFMVCGLLVGTFSASAQNPAQQKSPPNAERTAGDRDATYGRVKEFASGQKLVIDINNAPDKSYDLAKDRDVVVPQTLKVGDTVKITERDMNGKKAVTIAMDNTPGVQYGDPQK